ncbi:hypothetical protein BC629DRAFT_353368 [Irpex lacteus]|nr:hypothetical protein BC629DRAFT_353368 [Irpex lacteus]
MDTPSPNRPQCSRIITASPLASPSSNPEAAFSSRDTLVHNFEIALRRQGPLSACGKMAKPILPTIHSPDLPPRIAGSSLPRDFETEESRALGAQSRKTSTPSLTASTSSPFSASSPHTPSHESYTYTSSTYTSPVLATRRSPITRSRSGSHASTSYTYSISTSPTIHTASPCPSARKYPSGARPWGTPYRNRRTLTRWKRRKRIRSLVQTTTALASRAHQHHHHLEQTDALPSALVRCSELPRGAHWLSPRSLRRRSLWDVEH